MSSAEKGERDGGIAGCKLNPSHDAHTNQYYPMLCLLLTPKVWCPSLFILCSAGLIWFGLQVQWNSKGLTSPVSVSIIPPKHNRNKIEGLHSEERNSSERTENGFAATGWEQVPLRGSLPTAGTLTTTLPTESFDLPSVGGYVIEVRAVCWIGAINSY